MSEALAKSMIVDLISDLPEEIICEIMARIQALEEEALRKHRLEIFQDFEDIFCLQNLEKEPIEMSDITIGEWWRWKKKWECNKK